MAKKSSPITWEQPTTKIDKKHSSNFLEFCLDIYPQKDKSRFDKEMNSFAKVATATSQLLEKSHASFAITPLLSAIAFWVKNTVKDNFHSTRNAEMMRDLIKQGFIGIKDTQGDSWTLQQMVAMGHDAVIEAIRCNDLWSMEKTEDYVQFYIIFVNWLSETTAGYVEKPADPDVLRTAQRKIPLSDFINIAKHLKEREQIISELFYYGGGRTLDDVLSLQVEDIEGDSIQFQSGSMAYPKHVIKKLLQYIGRQRTGYVFTDKKGARIDLSVPYRSLKTVAKRLSLDPTFSFMDFIKNH